MPALISRPCAGQSDLPALTHLVRRTRPAERLSDYPGILDLHELLGLPDIQARTRLWENAQGACRAFAIVDPWNNLWFDAAPEALDASLEHQIVAWGLECVRREAEAPHTGQMLSLDTNCLSDNLERRTLLERQGFVKQTVETVQMLRALDRPLPAPELPAGFGLRAVEDEAEVEALVALHRAAFATEEMTVAYRRAMMQTPGYDPALDLLAVAPDGQLSAFCVGQVNPEAAGKEGFTDPIGTHPNYRRRGLARAVLLESLRRLRQRGVEQVRLSTTSDNLAMLKTAASVQFVVEKTKLWFSKSVPWPYPG